MRFLNRKKMMRVVGSVGLCSFIFLDPPPATAASYEKAQKEQQVVLYTSLSLPYAKKVSNAFTSKYPGVNVLVNRMGSSSIVPKVLTERRVAKKDNADVVLTGADSLDEMLMQTPDIFRKYTSTERKPERGDLYSAVYFTIETIAYNTKTVSTADIPRRYMDLLRERWQGKAAINLNNFTWVYSMLDFFGQAKGMDFLKMFAKQNPMPSRGTTLMVQQWLGGGVVDIALPLNHDGIGRFKNQGLPVDWARLEDPLYADLATAGILGLAPHPNAAQLLVDFLLSKEGQTVLAKTGSSVMRDDISIKDGIDRTKLRFVSAEARAGAAKYEKIMNDLYSK